MRENRTAVPSSWLVEEKKGGREKEKEIAIIPSSP